MTEIDESSPLRYSLTQWHKSFGIITLLLIIWRIFWRLSYPAPALSAHLKWWEKRAACLTHSILYLLILIIPISGWISVSASPLDLPTLLFNKIPWPHLPLFGKLPNKNEISLLSGEAHKVAAYLLIFLLLVHIGAALRHRLILRDGVFERMSPKTANGCWITGVRSTFGAIMIILGSLLLYGYSGSDPVPLTAENTQVNFTFTLQGKTQKGLFTESTVDILVNLDDSATNRLRSTVSTAMVSTGNSQIDVTLASVDWFDSENYPQARFDSRKFVPIDENSYLASGFLQIKGIAREVSFPVKLVYIDGKGTARGSFVINRLDFNLGRNSQPGDEIVGYLITITFEFEI